MKEIFQSALDRAPQERSAFVREVCGEDDRVRAEVESLLVAHQAAGGFAEEGLGSRDLGLDLIGREIGAYRILSLLGAGGMGEVYRARDTILGREVAIKTLPSTFTNDVERRARFEREARVLATLNHPHIGAIYGLEHADGVQALVLELVEGETLAERLVRGALSVSETLVIARQLADALEAAHQKGIVHRDLKPANIKITPNGTVKVLDFGLAKATGPELPHSPPISMDATREGTILGTAAYMSPEQARAQTIDKRTDIWAFGCVLYEMLTGRVAFDRATVSDTVAAIIEREPDWSALPSDLSPTLNVYLRRCLQKNPRDRIHDAADLRLALEGAFDGPLLARNKPSWQGSLIAAATIVLLGFGATTVWLLKSVPVAPAVKPVVRVSVPTQPLAVLLRAPGPVVALSPDGSHLVYVAGEKGMDGQLYSRRLDSLQAKPIAGAELAHSPFFSPDGQSIAFFTGEGQLKKVSLAGGPPVTLCDANDIPHGGSWGVDNTIIFGGTGGLLRVSANSGKPELVVPTESEALWPEILPDGHTVLFTATGPERIWMHSLKTGERRLLVERGSHARYVSSGHLVYTSAGSLMAAPFDVKRLELLGPAVPVIEGVMMGLPREPAISHFAVSASGSLAYLAGPVLNAQHGLYWVDRQGKEESLNVAPRGYTSPRISPDGTRLALEVDQSGNRDIWIYDLVRKRFQQLTFDPAEDTRPAWTPDGQRVAFSSTRDRGEGNLFWQRVDGTGQAERLTSEPHADRGAWAFTPDAKTLLFTQGDPDTVTDVHLMSMERGYRSKPLLQERFHEGSPALSPDGRWIAYRSGQTGRQEINVRPFPNVDEGKWPITTDGGSAPLWAPGGRELFYQNAELMMVVKIKTEPTFTYEKPQVLFSGSYVRALRNFDISPDGQRFLMIKEATPILEPSARDEITVVLNWSEELKRLVPPR